MSRQSNTAMPEAPPIPASGEIAGYGRRQMLRTPWGDAGQLRGQRLPPGRGTSPREVARNQRERLFAAMVATVAEKSYAATRIADVLELSGVSRKAFYRHFSDKADCFCAAIELPLGAVVSAVEKALGGGESVHRGEEALAALLGALASQPAAARACLIEAYAAGAAAERALERAGEELEWLVAAALTDAQGRGAVSRELARAVLGGVSGVAHRHLREGREEELRELAAPLWRWALCLEPPPRPLPRRGSGDSTPTPLPPFAAHVPAERVLRAFATAVAAKGYGATSIAEIAAHGRISLSTFYEQFSGKEEALVAALDSSAAQLVAAAVPAARHAEEPGEAVAAAMTASCGLLAREPAFARLRAVDVYAAGGAAVAQRDRGDGQLFATVRSLAFESTSELDPLAVEATLGALHALLYRHVRDAGTDAVVGLAPLLTYVAMAPFTGATAALDAASATVES
jgi:AcrR family transcriptional regulator